MEQYIVTFTTIGGTATIYGIFNSYINARSSFKKPSIGGAFAVMEPILIKKWPDVYAKNNFFKKVNKSGFDTCPIAIFADMRGHYTITYNKIEF